MQILRPTRVSATPRFYSVLMREFERDYTQAKAALLACARAQPPDTNIRVMAHVLFGLRYECMGCVRGLLGDRVSHMTVGGASVLGALKWWMKECWEPVGCRVAEGFGCTEVGSISDDAGNVLPSVTVKLLDCPSLGYSTKDKPFPRGELLVKSPETISGYQFNQEETTKAFDSEGWFHTGDIVEMIGINQIHIVDRVKNIFKLYQGEYVAPAAIEKVLSQSRFVEHPFVTCADITRFTQNAPVAVVFPNLALIRESLGSPSLSLTECCTRATVSRLILHDFVSLGNKAHLRHFDSGAHQWVRPTKAPQPQIPWGVLLTETAFNVGNGLLTPSNKLNRPAAELAFNDAVTQFCVDCTPSTTVGAQHNSELLLQLLQKTATLL
eukprot:TRINITY_DN831_c0_g1_i2.p1 TRINITY_DN831_c0_g1~~TRINITY_DN831_c0_g1_i2.p1  ORF type:complete len:382 (-),score=43.69 TRINITY_DN831_c0_g1_i2:1335-2480(-)